MTKLITDNNKNNNKIFKAVVSAATCEFFFLLSMRFTYVQLAPSAFLSIVCLSCYALRRALAMVNSTPVQAFSCFAAH